MNDRMSNELIAILGVGATVLVVGVAILALGWNMYSSLNGRIDVMQVQYDALQEQFNRRFDTMQTENQRQHDVTRGENQRQHDVTRGEISQLRTENQRQHDEIKEVLRVFEGRITRLEERVGTGAELPE